MRRSVTVIPVEIVLLPGRCHRCVRTTLPVVGLWFDRRAVNGDGYPMVEHDGGWFLKYDDATAHVIETVCDDEVLVAHGSGPLRWSGTRDAPDGYLANSCHHCGSVLLNPPLHEAIDEFLAEHGSLDDLPRIPSHLRTAARDVPGVRDAQPADRRSTTFPARALDSEPSP
jgi:hypothetical protein